jgi:hypothetical protein
VPDLLLPNLSSFVLKKTTIRERPRMAEMTPAVLVSSRADAGKRATTAYYGVFFAAASYAREAFGETGKRMV